MREYYPYLTLYHFLLYLKTNPKSYTLNPVSCRKLICQGFAMDFSPHDTGLFLSGGARPELPTKFLLGFTYWGVSRE